MASLRSTALLALALSSLSANAASTITKAALAAAATTSPLPLTEYSYAYADIVNPYNVGRGPQSGFNQCNSTTEAADSQCQTAIISAIDDFCLWGSPGLTPTGTSAFRLHHAEGKLTTFIAVGDVEAAVVAYCTKSGHGARIMPEGTITAVQFMRTSGYIQVTGLFNQTGINLDPTDTGGELDPHGADLLGNPLGGLVYSSGFAADTTTLEQVISWNNFVGGGQFCFKLCDPTVSSPNYCENTYDLLGCSYNAPAAYAPGEFLSCEGDLQDVVGTYTSGGSTHTWSQPTSIPASSTLPWTPRIPASSSCVTHQSSDLFPVSALGYQAAGAATTTAVSGAGTATGKSGASTASQTGTSSAAGSTSTSSRASKRGSGVVGGIVALGVVAMMI